jgi:hypothetical protein
VWSGPPSPQFALKATPSGGACSSEPDRQLSETEKWITEVRIRRNGLET